MFFKKISILLLNVFVLAASLMAQKENDYALEWKKVTDYEQKGLTKSALQEVMKIYTLALKENNSPQQIKSSIFQIRYRQMTEEDSQEKNILYIDTLIARAKQPAKNILQSMQAELLWQYLQNNRYKFYNRTRLATNKSTDISTWTPDKLHSTVATLYKASLTGSDQLKNTNLNGYEAIITKGENTRQLRPTLYDFLVHRALEYFMNDERDLTRPAYYFTISNSAAFAPVAQFISSSFSTKDTNSIHHKALLLLQDLLKFHLTDATKDALLDADLIRLNFVNQYGVMENKSVLYETALKNIEQSYQGNKGAAQAMYLRSTVYNERGQLYEPFTSKQYQYEIKRAKELCEEVIKRYPGSEGAANCQNILVGILQPSVNLETEQVNLPGQPFRSLLKYKNVNTIYFRIIKISREEIKKLDRKNYENYWKNITALKAAKSWKLAIPDLLDYQDHSVEIKIDALETGTYFLLASINENFSLQKNIIARQLTHVSNISYLHNNNNEYHVLHRDKGTPLPGTKVTIWETRYDYNTGENQETKGETYSTDKNGYFKINKQQDYRNFLLQFKTSTDELFLDESNYSNYNSYEQPVKPVTVLFTDRSIYRPGQTVYFKGIVLQTSDKSTGAIILPDYTTTVLFRDANGQKINELKMITNDFGSYHGFFKIPEGGLNGQFSIFDQATNTGQSFNVEEYKRPKFSVVISKPSGTYRLLDSIKVTGLAKAYAGNNIDGAKVTYRVVRKVRYQPWQYIGYARKIFPPSRPSDHMEIANGETLTNAAGEFNINFKAIPDETVDKVTLPIFNYEVSADITDINGETRSGNTAVAVGYHSLQLSIDIDDKLTVDSLKTIGIYTTNLNGISEKAVATLNIYQLKKPERIFRERFWQQPDQFIMSRDEYYKLFPYDVYSNENEINNYAVATTLQATTDSTNQQWPVSNKLKAGWYKLVATATDKNGEPVKAEKYIQLTDDAAPANEAVIVAVRKGIPEPGEKISYSISTAFSSIWLIHSLSKVDKTSTTNYLIIKENEGYKKDIPITDADRGGMALSYSFVQHNRVYKGNEIFNIPWSNKELTISYSSFRDKLLPGSEEKWTLKITGNKSEKIAAEMVAVMYDASLDQFKPHGWKPLNIWPRLYNPVSWAENGFSATASEEYNRREYNYAEVVAKSYDHLMGFGHFGLDDIVVVGYGSAKRKAISGQLETAEYSKVQSAPAPPEIDQVKFTNPTILKDEEQSLDSTKAPLPLPDNSGSAIQIRKNFNETAFFFPELKTDEAGNITFSITMPEALTEWKLMTFAHTKSLATGYAEKSVVTQKPLMVQPNAPRFVREGDRMEFSAKVVNLSAKEITGTALLELIDAATNKPVDGWLKNVFANQYFTVAAGQSTALKFPMEIPFNFNTPLTYRITAKSTSNDSAGTFSDGEEMVLPVLTNRMLVTESVPLNLRNTITKSVKFDKLINSGNSTTITNHSLTVEYTTNPVWYAVQALPYLMEYPYECAEQTFNRFYANTLAAHITATMPKIKNVYTAWAKEDQTENMLLSNLQKNQELKSALLEETPWVMDAQNESLQKKNIALLFDVVKMSSETDKALTKLIEMQSSNGGIVWFKGGPDDRYITQYILTSIGHLKKLNALSSNSSSQAKTIKQITDKAIIYLDIKLRDEYNELLKSKAKLTQNNLSNSAIQYLYMRSFFTEYLLPAGSQPAFNYYNGQAKKYWLSSNKYMQAMIALSLHRTGDKINPAAILKSLKENSILNEELGMYWKEWTTGGYYWHQAPIESQALMIEAFNEISKNAAVVDDLKTWLLKQKQTQNWRTTRATAEACYGLLLTGSNWLQNETGKVTIKLGETQIASEETNAAGSGYFKKAFSAESIKPIMGNISVTNTGAIDKQTALTSWGAVYWQYFEDLDKITPASTPLKIAKKLFIQKNSDKGPVLVSIDEGTVLKVGDKVTVRIELQSDRAMEYLHMKDMRAAAMEPVNVLSGYKYQGGLGYYESTKDASTNFFISWLPRGSYVFEYSLFVTLPGNFSNGITSIQCMYAPEFVSHSQGIRVNVEGK